MSETVLPFQARVWDWALACFGLDIASESRERNHRFIEEALELVQANGVTASEAHQLVDYVFDRPIGETRQEVGGVMITLALLCSVADNIDMREAGEIELTRIWTKIDKIRAKQAAKPKHGPLPAPGTDARVEIARLRAALRAAETFVMRELAWRALNCQDMRSLVASARDCLCKIEEALAS